ncbi:MAG: Gmad2 immunoglobulin-like domain-containing protein [Candidatus Paceibacterota bacterium]|nr:MAG: Gmad2 immunoglobulin-like domain-containing protein [Candidatus Paceibacterota bacterium]
MNTRISAIVIALLVIASVLFMARDRASAPEASLSPTPEPNIVVTSPRAGDLVSNPFTVTGRARVFENTFSYRLLGANNEVLFEYFGTADAPDIGQFGDFEVKVPIPSGAPADLTLQVFEYSAKDGSIVNLVSVPVRVKDTTTTTFQVFFQHEQKQKASDPQLLSCDIVFPVSRTVFKTSEVAYLALQELLSGVRPAEAAQGFSSTIPKHVGVNRIAISNGIASVDFSNDMGGGSCAVTARRAQLEKTLKQFPTVKQTVFSVFGGTENILQP